MVELLSETVWDWIPDGMNLGQWYAQRTSMDISRYFRELDLIPGSRRSTLQADGSCRWTDLGATRYQVSVHHGPKRGRQSNWEQEYWLYMGTTAAPLKPMSVLPIRIVLDLDRKIGGRVTAPPGKKLPPLRVQVWYDAEIPGLEKAYGYSVTHVREDETFEATGIGPGPYRVTVQDVKDRIVEVKGVPEGAPELKIVYTPAADE
jgi:hypothetical protein